MKLRNRKKIRNLQTQLQVLKLSYKKKLSKRSTELILNKIAQIILEYHLDKKKILFVGFPDHFSTILKNTRHLLIPEAMWLEGILTNTNFKINRKKKNKLMPENIFKLSLKLKKKADLVLVSGLQNRAHIIKESNVMRIPNITIAKETNILNTESDNISGGASNFLAERAESAHFIFSVIYTVLVLAKKLEKTYKKKF